MHARGLEFNLRVGVELSFLCAGCEAFPWDRSWRAHCDGEIGMHKQRRESDRARAAADEAAASASAVVGLVIASLIQTDLTCVCKIERK